MGQEISRGYDLPPFNVGIRFPNVPGNMGRRKAGNFNLSQRGVEGTLVFDESHLVQPLRITDDISENRIMARIEEVQLCDPPGVSDIKSFPLHQGTEFGLQRLVGKEEHVAAQQVLNVKLDSKVGLGCGG